ncbi:MAG: GNAT family N-acetyltransferase [Acidobacteriota bacterium]
MQEFEISPASHNDREQVIQLMGKIYPGDMAARYDWLYTDNPHGRALSWLAIERASGEAVGCTSIFPRKVMVLGRERVGGIGGDCFIEPRVRRQGLATALHAVSFAQMRERGVDFMYGPPTRNNLGALVKAGSHLVTNYKRWVRPLTSRGAYRAAFSRMPTKGQANLANIPIRVLDRLTRSNARGYTLEEINDFGDFGAEFDVMFQRASTAHPVACRRDCSYLAWRYLAAPARSQTPLAVRQNGRLEGFVAIERAGEFAAIADLFSAPDAKLMDAILQLAIENAAAAGCSSIEISLTQDSALARRVRRHGFIGREERGFQVAVADEDPQRDVLLKAQSWHFTEADQDMDRVFVSPPSSNESEF